MQLFEESSTSRSDWVSIIDLPYGADGLVGGGPWRLQVIRTSYSRGHFGGWWALHTAVTTRGSTVHFDEVGDACRVEVVSSEPFEEAAEQYGLDPEVFGSPTLWPGVSNQVAERGWMWTFTDMPEPFPFASSSAAPGLIY
jgi:hypothetical protein